VRGLYHAATVFAWSAVRPGSTPGALPDAPTGSTRV